MLPCLNGSEEVHYQRIKGVSPLFTTAQGTCPKFGFVPQNKAACSEVSTELFQVSCGSAGLKSRILGDLGVWMEQNPNGISGAREVHICPSFPSRVLSVA